MDKQQAHETKRLHVPEARLLWEEGAPFLLIDGQKHEPLVLFVNSDMDLIESMDEVGAELAYARREGIPFVSMPFTFPWPGDSAENRDWLLHRMEKWLDFIIDKYPEAYLLPRIWLGPGMEQIENTPDWQDEIHSHANGMKSPVLSVNSEVWRSGMGTALRDGIAYYESHPRFASRVVGYHIASGTCGEWFYYNYREYGSDVSPANRKAFRNWLLGKYGSDGKWAEAWGGRSIDADGNPIIYQQPDLAGKPFLASGADQPHVDYTQFSSESMADGIIEASRIVKEATNGGKLVVAFYGYPFELNDAHSGHLAIDRVLAAPEVDILASPISYFDRGVGGSASFMAAVDSVSLHRKLWMIEDDTRTHRAERTEFDENFGTLMLTAELTTESHKRNLGAGIVHRTGIWWMDLAGKGWLNDSALWDNIGRMQQFYKQYWKQAKPLAPDAVFIIDEKSMQFTGQGLSVNSPLLYKQRFNLYRAGISYGLYMMDDAVNGRIPQAQMYVFLNAHRVDAQQREGLERLKQSGGTFVWVYGADFIDVSEAGAVTGFRFKQTPGVTRTGVVRIGEGVPEPWASLAEKRVSIGIPDVHVLLSDQSMPIETQTIPYYAVQPDEETTAIGHYEESATDIAIAARDFAGWKSVFVGTGELDVRLIRSIASYAGVHAYIDTDDVLHTDGTFVCLYATSAGSKTLKLPREAAVRDALTGIALGDAALSHTFDMYRGETRWLLIDDQK